MKSIYSKKAKKIRYFLAFLKVGATGFEPATTCSQNRSATGLRYTPLTLLQLPTEIIKSGRQDSNLRPPVPKTGALPGCATPRLKLMLSIIREERVGATGFEPATTCSQNRSATGLRYTPLYSHNNLSLLA